MDHEGLRRARLAALALLAGPVPAAAALAVIPTQADLSRLATPVGVIGLISLVIAYRVYVFRRDALPAGTAEPERGRAFLGATVTALAITEAGALLGLVVFWGSGSPESLSGLASHLLAAAVVWPTETRLSLFGARQAGDVGTDPR